MDFILSLKLQANSKSALVKPAKQQTETKTKQSSENWEGKAGRLEQLRSLSHGWGGKALAGAAEQSQPQQQCWAHFTYLPVPGICLGNSEGAQLIKKVFWKTFFCVCVWNRILDNCSTSYKRNRLKTRSRRWRVVCTGSNIVGKGNNEEQLIWPELMRSMF